MVTTVSSTTALVNALKAANSGDTILLAPGSYSTISLYNLHFAQDVVVASANPNDAAVISGLSIKSSNGITFQDVEFHAPGPASGSFLNVLSSQDIHFQRVSVYGTLDGNPQNDTGGILFNNASNVSVTDSEFQQLRYGVSHANVDGLVIKDSSFHDLRLDGVRGGGSSNVTITGNTFSDFYPLDGDHADAVQFWTVNTTTAAHHITISDNVILRGSGSYTQGIFMKDEVGTLAYQQVVISGNLVSGGQYHGITVVRGSGVTIQDNIVQGFSDMKSWIFMDRVDGLVLKDNAANELRINESFNATNVDNVILPLATDEGAAAYAMWVDAHLAGRELIGDDGANALAGGAGADTLDGGAGVDTLTGGAGDDVYYTTLSDMVVEVSGGGVDTVFSQDSLTLPAHVENVVLTGYKWSRAYGNELDNVISGNSKPNLLQGNQGADTLQAGAGADSLYGGAGNDVLVGGTGVDRFGFEPGNGRDIVRDFGLGGEADVLDVSAFLKIGRQPTLTEDATGVSVAFGEDVIVLVGVRLADLSPTAIGYVF
jgi:Ca2+-binding RTX toxin-like protein